MGPSALHSEVAAADRAPHRGPLKRHFGSHFTKAIIPSLNATSSSSLQNSCLGPPTCTPLGQALRFTGRDPWVYGALGATSRVPTSREPPRGKATLKGKCRVPSAGPRCPALHGMEGPGLSSSQPPLAHPPPSLRPHSHHTAQGRWNRWPPTAPTGLALPGRLPGSLFFARPRPPQEHWGFPWVLPSLPPVCHSALSHSTGTTRPQPPRRRKCREGEPAGRGEAALRGEVAEGGLGRGAHLPRSGSEGLLGT